jgi:hypothetical protein
VVAQTFRVKATVEGTAIELQKELIDNVENQMTAEWNPCLSFSLTAITN